MGADHQFLFDDAAAERRLFLGLDTGTEGFHPCFALVGHATPPVAPSACADNTSLLDDRVSHQRFPLTSTTTSRPRMLTSPMKAMTASPVF